MATDHKVKQGECLASIAKRYGFADWKKIYDHPQNAGFKQKRKNPNVLFPGDKIFIPDREPKEENCPAENKHRFKLKGQGALLRLALKDAEGQPYSNKKYRMEIDGQTYEGTTKSDGLIEEKIPAGAEEGYLTVWLKDENSGEGFTWRLNLGQLDPVEAVRGSKARLKNLGLYSGPVNGDLDDGFQEAVKAFQAKVGLNPSGMLDEATKAQLLEKHDSA